MSTDPGVFAAPGGAFSAEVSVPGDKSLSHRALIFAGMAEGESTITGLAPGDDVASTVAALSALGVRVSGGRVVSPGVSGWRAPGRPIDCGNSGTTMRLLAGALAGRPFETTLAGDASLMRRPMERVARPLGALGARVSAGPGGTAPLVVSGGRLRGTDIVVPVASAQVRSAAALAALQAEGATSIDSPPGFRDHTERRLEAEGRGRWASETRFVVDPGSISPGEIGIPGDPSSAAFLLAAAAMRPDARVTVRRMDLNPGRTGFLDVLTAMGACVIVETTGSEGGEPVGDVTVTGGTLSGVDIGGALTVRCLDELPVLAVVAGIADGPTRIADAAELRAKESDRIAAVAALVTALGGRARAAADGLEVSGGASYRPADVDAGGDHRIVMAAAVAATAAGRVAVAGASAASVSWPGFGEALEAVWSSR
jgi:3-phosphoshikimate 1-carboxyvinyltransferase